MITRSYYLPIIIIIYLSLLLFAYHYYYLPIIIIICLSLLLFAYHYYYLPIIIIICLSLLLFAYHYYYLEYDRVITRSSGDHPVILFAYHYYYLLRIDCILFMRIDYYCILSIKFEIQSFICLNKIKQAF